MIYTVLVTLVSIHHMQLFPYNHAMCSIYISDKHNQVSVRDGHNTMIFIG